MYFNMEESCAAWTVTHRFILVYDYIDNPTSQVVSEFQTVEAKDGGALEFRARRVRDGETQEEIEGKTVRGAEGKPFKARYKKPETTDMKLGPETLFPTQQTIRTINAALQKQKFITGTVFDGSDTDGPYQVSGLVLKPLTDTERSRLCRRTSTRIWPASPAGARRSPSFPCPTNWRLRRITRWTPNCCRTAFSPA